MRVSIIIPTCAQDPEEFLKPCIESIYKNTTDFELIVIANGCHENVYPYLSELKERKAAVYLHADKMGYTKPCNFGLRVSSSEHLILLNDDTILMDQAQNTWTNMLLEPFKDARMAITGPSELLCPDTGQTFLVGFCTCFSRKFLKESGLYDEVFSPGFGEDIDICLRARSLLYKTRCVSNTLMLSENQMTGEFPIFHRGEGTFHKPEFHSNYENIVARNKAELKKRWQSGYYADVKPSITIPHLS